ncbi:ribonuclease H-like domain-containing protein [Tanacetum coccineum]
MSASSSQDEIPPPPPPPPSSQTPTQQTPHTVSTIKLPILKKGEYDIWAMKMEHYLAHTDYPIWEVIQNGNGPVSITTDTSGQIKVLPPRTAEEIVARERERKARTTLLMALPEDHLAKFHKMKGLHKGYDRFQSLLSQLEIHGAGVSTEDANKKFLRSLPSAWSQVSLIMRTKPEVDTFSFDDLYNNLRVFESDIKGSTASLSSSPQNYEQTSSYSLLANQSSCPQLDHEDLEQIDEYDLEEMDLKWQVAMISMRMKKFYKKTGRKLQFDAKEAVGFDKTKVECYNCHKTGHFARECRIKGTQDNRRRDAWNSRNKDRSRTGQKEDSKALVTIDGEGIDWTNHSEDEDYALMACNSSDSDTEVISCSNKCKESYANLKKLYDAQREQLSDASIEIKAYSQGLKKVEAQLVAHQQGQLWYEQKIKFMKIDLDDKTDVLTYHKKLLAEAQKEKEDLKAKVEKWHNSSKNLSKLLNTQMSANDKFGLGYGDHRYDGILSYENEVLQSVFMNKESEIENQPLYDRFVTAEGMHAVPPPMTGNYMPSGPDVEVDDSKFTYGPKQTQPSESESQSSEFDTCESNISAEPSELVSEPVVNESNVECQPKVWSDALYMRSMEFRISEDVCVSNKKTPVLLTNCDFHEKRMARKAELNNGWNNVQRVNKQNQFVPSAVLTRTGIFPVNTARTSGTKNFSTVRQSVNRQTVLTSTAMKVNTVKPIVNRVRPAMFFTKTHSPSSSPFKSTKQYLEQIFLNKVNTAKDYAHRTLKIKELLIVDVSRPHEWGGLACLFAKATIDESNKWHRRLGHVNFKKNLNKLLKGNLVRGRVLVTKPHNKTPYELLTGKIPIISYIRPFGYHVTILNTIDHLGKFAGKSDEGFLVGYSLQSKAFRVYNLETKRVEENLHITFLENKPNVAGKGPTWLFDLDYLTDSMNYHPVSSENQANLHAGQQEANQNAGTEEITDAGDSDKEDESAQDCFVLPIWPSYSSTITPALTTDDKREGPREEEQVFMDDLERLKRQEEEANEEAEALRKKFAQETENLIIQEGAAKPSSTNIFSTVSTPAKASSTNLVNTVSLPVSTASSFEGLSLSDPTNPEEDDSEIPPLEDIYQNSTDGIFTTSSYDDMVQVADSKTWKLFEFLEPMLLLAMFKSKEEIIIRTSSIVYLLVSMSQNEPKKISEALEDES